MNQTMKMPFILLSIVFLFTAFAGSAWALTASNSQIINNASLTYNDGTGVKTVNALPVVVTVSLLPGTPTVTKDPDQTTPYTGPNTPLTNTFTITASNTNGPDTYSLTPAITATVNATGSSVTLTSPTSPVLLGATVTLSGSTATVLVVPADGNAGDSQVNGIAVNDGVVVNGDTVNPRQVTGISDNAAGTSTITLASALASGIPVAGLLVGEQKTVTVTANSGTITTGGANIVITKHLTITSTTDASKTAVTTDITDTYTSGLASLNKYVRNVTAVPTMTGTGAKYTYNSIDYWPSGITAKPGEVLEYILVATNSGSGPVTASVVTDALPISYVALKPNAYAPTREITYVNDSGAPTTYSAASDADQATYVPATGTLTVYVGAGATNSAGGSIPGGNKFVLVLYQVTVNN